MVPASLIACVLRLQFLQSWCRTSTYLEWDEVHCSVKRTVLFLVFKTPCQSTNSMLRHHFTVQESSMLSCLEVEGQRKTCFGEGQHCSYASLEWVAVITFCCTTPHRSRKI